MNKKILAISVVLGLALIVAVPVLAEENSATSSAGALIEQLRQQIESLQAQIQTLMQQLASVKETAAGIKDTKKEVKSTVLQLRSQMQEGMTSDEIKTLQEILATDPSIYPEGLKTGYFGPLTKMAIKRFQEKFGIEQAGRVGPKTLAKLNDILTNGAGNSGKVPPGLLIAPGILKKLGTAPQPLSGQELPYGVAKKLGTATTSNNNGGEDEGNNDENNNEGEEDITAPIISELGASNIASTSATISWTTDEDSDSKLWYSMETPVDISLDASMESADLTTEHSFSLVGLTASSTYYYAVSSTDSSANMATSSELSFTTPAE